LPIFSETIKEQIQLADNQSGTNAGGAKMPGQTALLLVDDKKRGDGGKESLLSLKMEG